MTVRSLRRVLILSLKLKKFYIENKIPRTYKENRMNREANLGKSFDAQAADVLKRL